MTIRVRCGLPPLFVRKERKPVKSLDEAYRGLGVMMDELRGCGIEEPSCYLTPCAPLSDGSLVGQDWENNPLWFQRVWNGKGAWVKANPRGTA
jgi:hypothetical protein